MAACGVMAADAARGASGLWERVASSPRDAVPRLVSRAEELLAASRGPGGDRKDLAAAERALTQALVLEPREFRATLLLGEVQAAFGRSRDAVRLFERARDLAASPGQQALCSFRLGVERSKLGQYAEALAEYDREIALGDPSAATLANSAELLMALGRLGDAQERYREAIRTDEQAATDRRMRAAMVAAGYYGLSVALDRDGQPAAAREMMSRALALDPGATRLERALHGGGEEFFVPSGDVYYYLGLAYEVAGRPGDAVAAFTEFIAKVPSSPWAPRARAHIAAGGASGEGSAPRKAASGPRARIAALATVRADGPIPSPLIDAALKSRPGLAAPCLELIAAAPAGTRGPLRVGIEVDIDARGRVSRAAVRSAPGLAPEVSSCLEAAIKRELVLDAPGHRKPTRARLELLIDLPAAP